MGAYNHTISVAPAVKNAAVGMHIPEGSSPERIFSVKEDKDRLYVTRIDSVS